MESHTRSLVDACHGIDSGGLKRLALRVTIILYLMLAALYVTEHAVAATQEETLEEDADKNGRLLPNILAGVQSIDEEHATPSLPDFVRAPMRRGWSIELQRLDDTKETGYQCQAPNANAELAREVGLQVILRMDWRPGNKETIPTLKGPSYAERLAHAEMLATWADRFKRCVTMHLEAGFSIYIVGNEPNLLSEGSVGPVAYAEAYNMVYRLLAEERKKHPELKLLVATPAPGSGGNRSVDEQWVSPTHWFLKVLHELEVVDAFGVHTYGGFGGSEPCEGCERPPIRAELSKCGACSKNPSVWCPVKGCIGPVEWCERGIRFYRVLAGMIKAARPTEWINIPLYITEFNTASDKDNGTPLQCYEKGWANDVFDEVRNYNACNDGRLPPVRALAWFSDEKIPGYTEFSLGLRQPGDRLDQARVDLHAEFRDPRTRSTVCDIGQDHGIDPRQVGGGGHGLAVTWGDPHLVSFDGLGYDFQAVGEFIAVESIAGAPLRIQIRQGSLGAGSQVAINTAVAATVGADRVALYAGKTPPLLVNGAPTPLLEGGSVYLSDGGSVRLRGGRYQVSWPANSGEELEVTPWSNRLDVRIALPPGRKGQIRGLFGQYDADSSNDIATRAGVGLRSPTFQELYSTYADSWRIAQSESLFDYATGESTTTFTDRSTPQRFASTQDLSVEIRDAARRACLARSSMDPATLEACTLDVALSGDASYTESAADAAPPTTTLGTNLAARMPVRAAGPTIGDPQHLTDGIFAAEGHVWDDPLFAVVAPQGSSLAIDLGQPRVISRIVVQADNNDAYMVELSMDGSSWGNPILVPEYGPAGLRSRPPFTVPQVLARYLRIRALSGDERYSISEVQVYGPPTALR